MEYLENLRHRIFTNIYKKRGLAYLKFCLTVCRLNAPIFLIAAVTFGLIGFTGIKSITDFVILTSMIVFSVVVSLIFLYLGKYELNE